VAVERSGDHPLVPPLTPEERQAVLDARDRVRALTDAVFDSLYLAGRRGGPAGSGEEALTVAMAASADIAADNARLVARARSQERWQRAAEEVTSALLSEEEPRDVLQLVTWHARDISGAELVVLVLPTRDGSHLTVENAVGPGSEEALGLTYPTHPSLSGVVMDSGEVLIVDDFSIDERAAELPQRKVPFGPAVVFPLGLPGDVRGVMTAGRGIGSPPMARAAVELVTTFAAQAGISLKLAEHRRDAQRIALLADRDRIARDLHDLVIQRLFATGMSLQGALPLMPASAAADRVARAVGDLDDTVRDIRSAIFTLQQRDEPDGPGLRASIVTVAGEMTGPLGFAPSLRLDGALDSRVPREIADDVLMALREALANAARHASASVVEVIFAVSGDETGSDLVLVVCDDGTGIGTTSRRSGLANLARRAAELGGSLSVTPGDGGGTRLEWRVPLAGESYLQPGTTPPGSP
jgi:signal transduction histidine kinase